MNKIALTDETRKCSLTLRLTLSTMKKMEGYAQVSGAKNVNRWASGFLKEQVETLLETDPSLWEQCELPMGVTGIAIPDPTSGLALPRPDAGLAVELPDSDSELTCPVPSVWKKELDEAYNKIWKGEEVDDALKRMDELAAKRRHEYPEWLSIKIFCETYPSFTPSFFRRCLATNPQFVESVMKQIGKKHYVNVASFWEFLKDWDGKPPQEPE